MSSKPRWAFLLLAGLAFPAAAGNRKAPPWEKPLETGRYLFRENCTVCHEISQPKSRKFGTNLYLMFRKGRMTSSKLEATDENVAAKIKAGGAIMPAFRNVLTDDQIEKIIAYIRSRQ